MAGDPPLVFVYGTLRRGFSNRGRDILDLHGELLAQASVAGRLFDLGDFPAMVEPETRKDRVSGEVYRLTKNPERALERLDRYEGARGANPLPYERRDVEAELADGTEARAWAYIWTDDVEAFERVPDDDWAAYVGSGPDS